MFREEAGNDQRMDEGGFSHGIDVSNGYLKHFSPLNREFCINSCSDKTGVVVFRGGRKSTALTGTLSTWLQQKRQLGRKASGRNLRVGGHSEQNFGIGCDRDVSVYRGAENG